MPKAFRHVRLKVTPTSTPKFRTGNLVGAKHGERSKGALLKLIVGNLSRNDQCT